MPRGILLFRIHSEDMSRWDFGYCKNTGRNGTIQDEKMTVIKGKMGFAVLYRKEDGGPGDHLGGNIPLRETVNVPGIYRS